MNGFERACKYPGQRAGDYLATPHSKVCRESLRPELDRRKARLCEADHLVVAGGGSRYRGLAAPHTAQWPPQRHLIFGELR